MIGHRVTFLGSFAVAGVSAALFVGLATTRRPSVRTARHASSASSRPDPSEGIEQTAKLHNFSIPASDPLATPAATNRALRIDSRPATLTPPTESVSLGTPPLPESRGTTPGNLLGKDRRINNSRILTVGHVSNVPGTMESCPTYFCADPKREPKGVERASLALAEHLTVAEPLALAKPPVVSGEWPVPSTVGLLEPVWFGKAMQASAVIEMDRPPEAIAAVHAVSVAPGTPRMRLVASAALENEGDQSLEIHFPDADIVEVLEALSQQGNLNILATDSVQGKVSVNLIGVDVEDALEAILKSTRFVARRDGKFIYIGTHEDFSEMEHSLDAITTRVYRPNYVTAMELQTLIQPLVTQDIGLVSVSSPAEVGIESDDANAGGDAFAGGEVVLVRDYEAVLGQIDQIVEEIDVRPLQVAIEAMILAVKVDDEHSLGVSFELLRNNPNVRYGLGTPLNNLPAALAEGGLQYAFIDSSIGTFVEALESTTDTNVIAAPRLLVLNKHRAEIQIGKSDGYVSSTITETSTSQNVEFLDTGTLLRLRPFISSDGMIRMEIHPELSSGEVTLKGQFTVPEKEVTQVTTNVMVRDGCTVIIGGLMREQLVSSSSQIPFLGSLPWVGPLFRNKQEDTKREEILVLITPRIVYEPDTCREGSRAACEFHRRQAVNAEKFSPLGKRHVARRYYRLAQEAQAAGDVDRALEYAEMAVHFDPMNNAAIELRSNIWLGIPADTGISPYPAAEQSMTDPLRPDAPWPPDDLKGAADSSSGSAHPHDPGHPGYHTDLTRPGIWE